MENENVAQVDIATANANDLAYRYLRFTLYCWLVEKVGMKPVGKGAAAVTKAEIQNWYVNVAEKFQKNKERYWFLEGEL